MPIDSYGCWRRRDKRHPLGQKPHRLGSLPQPSARPERNAQHWRGFGGGTGFALHT